MAISRRALHLSHPFSLFRHAMAVSLILHYPFLSPSLSVPSSPPLVLCSFSSLDGPALTTPPSPSSSLPFLCRPSSLPRSSLSAPSPFLPFPFPSAFLLSVFFCLLPLRISPLPLIVGRKLEETAARHGLVLSGATNHPATATPLDRPCSRGARIWRPRPSCTAVLALLARPKERRVWKLLVDMNPAEALAVRRVSVLTDRSRPDEALENPAAARADQARAEADMRRTPVSGVTTFRGGSLTPAESCARSAARRCTRLDPLKMKGRRDIEDDRLRAPALPARVLGRRAQAHDGREPVWDGREASANPSALAYF